MGYVRSIKSRVGTEVILTETKKSLSGYFEKGSVVTITDEDPIRGYTFQDKEGNKVVEAGFSGFRDVS